MYIFVVEDHTLPATNVESMTNEIVINVIKLLI